MNTLRLAEQLREARRVIGWLFDLKGMRTRWQMASATGTLGYSTRYTQTRDPNDPTGIYGTLREGPWNRPVETPRDFYDQLMDFIGGYLADFHRLVFVEAACTHPHERVRTDMDGDEETGRYEQHICQQCHGYVLASMVDRYRPLDQRHPELVDRDPAFFSYYIPGQEINRELRQHRPVEIRYVGSPVPYRFDDEHLELLDELIAEEDELLLTAAMQESLDRVGHAIEATLEGTDVHRENFRIFMSDPDPEDKHKHKQALNGVIMGVDYPTETLGDLLQRALNKKDQ